MNIRRVATTALIILSTLTVLFLLWLFNEALIIFIFSLAVAAAIRPFVDRMINRGIPRTRALILVYFLIFAGFLSIILLAGSSIVNELQLLSDNMARTYDSIWAEWPKGTQFQKMIVQQLPAPADLYDSFSPEKSGSTLQGLLGFTMVSAGFIGQLVTVLILSIYWSIDRVYFERLWLSLLPVESRARSRDIWRDIERDFGTYIRSEIIQSILAGIMLGLGLWAMGVKYPAMLAIFGALAWLVPWLGGLLAVLPVALVGFSQSTGLGVLSTAFAIGVMVFVEFYVEPRFIRQRNYSSLFSILLIIALVEPFGLMGLIVAPPIAAAIELGFHYYLQNRQTPFSLESAKRISGLRARIEDVRQMAEQGDEPLEPQTLSMLQRLEDLIHKADNVLEEDLPEKQNTAASITGGLR